MTVFARLRSWLRAVARGRRLDSAIREELEFHIDACARSRGAGPQFAVAGTAALDVRHDVRLAILVVTAMAAAWVPAWRAGRISPTAALRHE